MGKCLETERSPDIGKNWPKKMLSEQIVGERMKTSSGCSCLYLAEPNRHG